ncbi:DUF1569 domain-containing protein [Flaviramulus sp. BrNp1-15]|uniref:DUF1569 domain-containing protein n=1 Tax=Flaviramulus sp. BrNp1-15 TaxID=2916754 RepID=UPI001EE80038|nr:DUF1569 domain-containing protein [Flaviramulus sp. BrNp1-15]ULC59998.1 DUF1569 domain-containing protein [Flaviramulus sp. BrNp1-15]
MSSKHYTILQNQLSQIETYLLSIDKKNPKVSKSTVGWQLDHALKVFNSVCEWTENSNPKDYKWKFNFWRSILFRLNYIPRGKGKAPKFVLPPEIIHEKDLKNQLETARAHIERLKTLPKSAYFKHFIFGMLSKKKTLRFLEMHTKHHLKIVRDILK